MKLRKIYIILLLIILGCLFYWYEARPAQIRSFCNSVALPVKQDSWSKAVGVDKGERIRLQYSAYNDAYDECLHSKGIKE